MALTGHFVFITHYSLHPTILYNPPFMTVEFFRHPGDSFVPGKDQVHIQTTGIAEAALAGAWNRYLAAPRIAQPLTIRETSGLVTSGLVTSGGMIRAHAPCYPFLPETLLRRVIETAVASSEAVDEALVRDLRDHAYDHGIYEETYALHRNEALRRGWPAWPLLVGRMQSLILGAGRHHVIVPMNLSPSASGLIGIAGQNKATGRDLLAAYGIPIAPGGLAMTPDQALARAQAIGWPVVLKRLSGGNSDGVILNISTAEQCRSAAEELLGTGGAILVEKKLPGIELRVHFIAGRIQQILLRVPEFIAADGSSSLRRLIEQARPSYLKLADHSATFQKQLVYRLWEFGARTFADLDGIVLPAGQKFSLGKDIHMFRDKAAEKRALHPADRKRIEAFLRACGSPGGALDVMVRHAGTPLSEGGAVLEINVPSGMWYLSEIDKVVARELDQWIAHRPGFRKAKGRVPLWVASDPDSRAGKKLKSAFRRRYPAGKSLKLSEAGGWAPCLTESADALLVFAEDEDIRRYGLPSNLPLTIPPDTYSRTAPQLLSEFRQGKVRT
jgi:hypothetical protein